MYACAKAELNELGSNSVVIVVALVIIQVLGIKTTDLDYPKYYFECCNEGEASKEAKRPTFK